MESIGEAVLLELPLAFCFENVPSLGCLDFSLSDLAFSGPFRLHDLLRVSFGFDMENSCSMGEQTAGLEGRMCPFGSDFGIGLSISN